MEIPNDPAGPISSAGRHDMRVEDLMAYLIEQGGSDLHLVAGRAPTVRLDGALEPVPGYGPLSPSDVEDMVRGLMTDEQRQTFYAQREVDFAYTYSPDARFRINIFHQRGSASAAMRLVPMNPVPLGELGLPPIISTFAELRDGLVLVTGPTGAGKTTTLAALVDKVNSERRKHIITIEDPIEYHHQHKQSIVQQREVGSDTCSFASVLRSVLREDPDVILIGEMRDAETIATAITAAETGHLVFATLHTGTAADSIDRMIDSFEPHQQHQVRAQLAACLRAVVSQRLLPRVGGGRVCVVEIMVQTPAVSNVIREGKGHQLETFMQTAGADGMVTFDSALASAVREGLVGYQDALEVAVQPQEFREMFSHNF